MERRYKVTTYLAGAMEHATKNDMVGWREEFKKSFISPDILIYDPVEMESIKVNSLPGEHNKYIKGLKKAGKYDKFFDEMWKIWFGDIDKNTEIANILAFLRNRKLIDGNYLHEISSWGDAEAVVRSDFIVVYLPSNIKTVGTIYEIVFAFLFKIPIYLILPDTSKTEANSSLLFGVMLSDGEVFYSLKDCIEFIKNKYGLE